MSFPQPKPGLVIRYAYLWRREAETGRDSGVKDRPCLVVLAVETSGGRMRVRVAPITHTPPRDPGDAVEMPAATKRRLGLDDERSWISTMETNVFDWPGPDLRPAEKSIDKLVFGFISGDVFRSVRDGIIANIEKKRSGTVKRTE